MPDKILVTGATGTVGGETLKRLVALGAPVRALVRNRAKAAAIETLGVEIAEGDLGNRKHSMPRSTAQRALLVSAPDPRQAELQNNLIDAAKRAGIRHIVKISAAGAAPDSLVSFLRWHAATEEYLSQSGVSFTILRPNFFMQNMLTFAKSIASEGKFYASMKD